MPFSQSCLSSQERNRGAGSSTGLRRCIAGAMMHLMSHYTYRGFGSIKELSGRSKGDIWSIMHFPIRHYLAVTNKL